MAGEAGFDEGADFGVEFELGGLGVHQADAGLAQFGLLGLLALAALLRFKANLRLALLGSELEQVLEAFVKGALVRGLVAQIEGKLAGVLDDAVGAGAQRLQIAGAAAQPFVLGQTVDQKLFGHSLGLVLGSQARLQGLELLGALPRQQAEGSSCETVLETVLRYGLLAGLGPRAGAALGVRPIGCDLGFSGHGVWGSLIPASTLAAPVKRFAQFGPILLGFWLVTELEGGRQIGPAAGALIGYAR